MRQDVLLSASIHKSVDELEKGEQREMAFRASLEELSVVSREVFVSERTGLIPKNGKSKSLGLAHRKSLQKQRTLFSYLVDDTKCIIALRCRNPKGSQITRNTAKPVAK